MNQYHSGDPAVVLIAYHYPPDEAVGSARLYRFHRYLAKRGFPCHVITPAPGPASEDVERIPDPFLSPTRDFGYRLELAARRFIYPGGLGMRWAWHASRAAERFLDRHPGPAVVLSSFPPIGAHLAAGLFAIRRNVPWIADYRDPLDESPWLEKRMLHTAKAIITNTDRAAQRIEKLYPAYRPKVHTIWNGFDPEQRLQAELLPERRHKLYSHIGDLYTGRTVSPILTALTRLVENGKVDPSALRLVLAGYMEPASLPPEELMRKTRAQGWLQMIPERIPLLQARHITATSDGVLLVQPQSSTQVPAKLFEYLQIGRPILAYVAHGSPSENILERAGVPYRCIYPDTGAAEMEQTLLEFLSLTSEPTEFSAWFRQQFSADQQTDQLIAILRQLR